MNEHARQTGRTHGMLTQAFACAMLGHRVRIYTHDDLYARQLRIRAQDTFGHHASKLDIARLPADFEWEIMNTRQTYHANIVVFVDHYAIERRLERIADEIRHLQMLQMQLYPLTVATSRSMPAWVNEAQDRRPHSVEGTVVAMMKDIARMEKDTAEKEKPDAPSS